MEIEMLCPCCEGDSIPSSGIGCAICEYRCESPETHKQEPVWTEGNEKACKSCGCIFAISVDEDYRELAVASVSWCCPDDCPCCAT